MLFNYYNIYWDYILSYKYYNFSCHYKSWVLNSKCNTFKQLSFRNTTLFWSVALFNQICNTWRYDVASDMLMQHLLKKYYFGITSNTFYKCFFKSVALGSFFVVAIRKRSPKLTFRQNKKTISKSKSIFEEKRKSK